MLCKHKRIVTTISKNWKFSDRFKTVRFYMNATDFCVTFLLFNIGLDVMKKLVHCSVKTSNRKAMKPLEYEKPNEAVFCGSQKVGKT